MDFLPAYQLNEMLREDTFEVTRIDESGRHKIATLEHVTRPEAVAMAYGPLMYREILYCYHPLLWGDVSNSEPTHGEMAYVINHINQIAGSPLWGKEEGWPEELPCHEINSSKVIDHTNWHRSLRATSDPQTYEVVRYEKVSWGGKCQHACAEKSRCDRSAASTHEEYGPCYAGEYEPCYAVETGRVVAQLNNVTREEAVQMIWGPVMWEEMGWRTPLSDVPEARVNHLLGFLDGVAGYRLDGEGSFISYPGSRRA